MQARIWKICLATLFLLVACKISQPIYDIEPTPSVTTSPTTTASAQPLPLLSTPTKTISPTYPTQSTKTAIPSPQPNFQVYFHPDSPLYVGDQISIEVIAPPQQALINQAITVSLDSPAQFLGSTTFQPFGYESRQQATFYWVWNTHGQSAGEHWLTFSIPSLALQWRQSVTLLSADALPEQEKQAHWQSEETNCCVIYTISGSAAQRDLPQLTDIVEEEFLSVQKQIPQQPKETLGIAFIPRVIGQGGFADQNVTISYLDRNYTAGEVRTILHHELVHIFDGWNGGDFKPALFMEGLAVYLSSGHYQPEPLLPRAAALLPLHRYISLPDLANDFYLKQHEIGYLEAGALVEYMVQRWGWQAFLEFYQTIPHEKDEKNSDSIDRALQAHFQRTFSDLERDFLAYLNEIPVSISNQEKVQALVEYYDTIRSYQQALDRSAYYQSGWMVNVQELIDRNIVADYWRHPTNPTNIALETMLHRAGEALQQGDLGLNIELTRAVATTLDRLRAGDTQPFLAHPLAKTYWEIVQQLNQAGFEAQQIDLHENDAEALVTKGSNVLIKVSLHLGANGWEIQSITQP